MPSYDNRPVSFRSLTGVSVRTPEHLTGAHCGSVANNAAKQSKRLNNKL